MLHECRVLPQTGKALMYGFCPSRTDEEALQYMSVFCSDHVARVATPRKDFYLGGLEGLEDNLFTGGAAFDASYPLWVEAELPPSSFHHQITIHPESKIKICIVTHGKKGSGEFSDTSVYVGEFTWTPAMLWNGIVAEGSWPHFSGLRMLPELHPDRHFEIIVASCHGALFADSLREIVDKNPAVNANVTVSGISPDEVKIFSVDNPRRFRTSATYPSFAAHLQGRSASDISDIEFDLTVANMMAEPYDHTMKPR
jgi:hypothetical protein